MKKLFFILLLIMSSVSLAGTIDPKNPDSEYLKYGSEHKCVVKINGVYKNDDKDFFASAVVIRPRIILTAAHVVHGAEKVCIVDNNNNNINVLFAFYLKEWDNNTFGQNDIALCFLEKNVILDFYPSLYDKTDEVGKICSISGFGITGNYLTGSNLIDGKKRAGSNIIDETFNNMLVTSVNRGKKTSLEFLIGFGDSGGGLFIDNKLAGIHSGIMTDEIGEKSLNSDYQDQAAHTRISLHKKWIESMIEQLEEFAKEN